MNADENRLYQRMAALLDEDDTFINIPGMYPNVIVCQYVGNLEAVVRPKSKLELQ